MRPYFVLSAHDDEAGVQGNMAMRPGWVQVFLPNAGMIAVISSILAGVFVGLLLAALVGFPLGATVGVGAAAFLVAVALQQRYHSSSATSGTSGGAARGRSTPAFPPGTTTRRGCSQTTGVRPR